MSRKKIKKNTGTLLIQVLVFGSIAAYLLVSLTTWTVSNIKASQHTFDREQAIQIAESGIDYYRWHLAHAPTDFQDGTGEVGPYVHDVYDKDGDVLGQFSLDITPPPLGSTWVEIKSTGNTVTSSTTRTIATQFAKPSIAKYAVVANADIRFGEGTEVFGPLHSNGGIRFDGTLAHNIVSSAKAEYDDPDHSGGNEFGVHTHLDPIDELPPADVPDRPDVFAVGRQFPVPAVDFDGMTADMAQMKIAAEEDGFHRPGSGALGYNIVLQTNDTFDLYQVTSFIPSPHWTCNWGMGSTWSTWSINNQQLIGNFPFPANGIIFLEDDVFVEGQIDGARLTIIAAYLPDNPPTRKNIIVNNDLAYTNYDGTDVIGLIAQGDMNVGMVSENNLGIDAALIAQNGRVGRHYYRPSEWWYSACSPYDSRQTITLYGMIATAKRYGFAYTDDTGYETRNINYDSSLLYRPPPHFPLTSDQYIILSWEEE